ncbi:hypothetical protein BD560DRAFT_426935 [Blakeslea trispora]|nr:hypothetical protein BD560DRAFT_426935 [Blakeslea trispora]
MNNNNDNHNYHAYPYGQYQPYYYQSYYPNPGAPQHVPQGDPSAALSSMMYQIQNSQQPQTSAYTPYYPYPSQQDNSYYANYYMPNNDQQRSMLNYDDLAHLSTQPPPPQPPRPNTTSSASVIHQQNTQPLKKPKFCCNRVLKTAMAVIQHEKLHTKCPDCDHMCLPSVLEEHEELVHGKVPLKKKAPDGIVPPNAPKINTPEELAAWIAARKKNWPSQANVERKEQEDKEKVARGELPNSRKRKSKQNLVDQQNSKKQKTEQLVAQYDSSGSDADDSIDPEKDGITSKDPSVMGKILLPEENRPKRRCKYFISGKCKRGDECTFLHERPEPKPKQPRPTPAINRRPNLLFKLLEKEIHQEKNVILQCLRHLVDSNFLGTQEAATLETDEEHNLVEDKVKTEGTSSMEDVIKSEHTDDLTLNTKDSINQIEEPMNLDDAETTIKEIKIEPEQLLTSHI